MSNSQRSPTPPLDAHWRLGTGIRLDLSERVTIGVAYQLLCGGDADLDVERGTRAGRLKGDCSSFFVNPVNATLVWRF
jgi:hypothetical protein